MIVTSSSLPPAAGVSGRAAIAASACAVMVRTSWARSAAGYIANPGRTQRIAANRAALEKTSLHRGEIGLFVAFMIAHAKRSTLVPTDVDDRNWTFCVARVGSTSRLNCRDEHLEWTGRIARLLPRSASKRPIDLS